MYTGPWGRVRKIWMEDGETRVSVPKWIVHVLLDSLDKVFITIEQPKLIRNIRV